MSCRFITQHFLTILFSQSPLIVYYYYKKTITNGRNVYNVFIKNNKKYNSSVMGYFCYVTSHIQTVVSVALWLFLQHQSPNTRRVGLHGLQSTLPQALTSLIQRLRLRLSKSSPKEPKKEEDLMSKVPQRVYPINQ